MVLEIGQTVLDELQRRARGSFSTVVLVDLDAKLVGGHLCGGGGAGLHDQARDIFEGAANAGEGFRHLGAFRRNEDQRGD